MLGQLHHIILQAQTGLKVTISILSLVTPLFPVSIAGCSALLLAQHNHATLRWGQPEENCLYKLQPLYGLTQHFSQTTQAHPQTPGLGFWLWLDSLAPGHCESCPKMAPQHMPAREQCGWETALLFYFCPFVNDTV